MEVRLEPGEEPAGQEGPDSIRAQRQPEQQGKRKSRVPEHDETSREAPLAETAQTEADVHEMRRDPSGDEDGGCQETRPRSEVEVADHARHAQEEDPELPARETLAPDGALEHDGNELKARSDDRKGDPAERHRVSERHHAGVVVVSRQLWREPRDADGGDNEGAGSGHKVRERHAHRRCAPGLHADHLLVTLRRMTIRTIPGCSSVSWVNPRSSSCGYSNTGRRSCS